MLNYRNWSQYTSTNLCW